MNNSHLSIYDKILILLTVICSGTAISYDHSIPMYAMVVFFIVLTLKKEILYCNRNGLILLVLAGLLVLWTIQHIVNNTEFQIDLILKYFVIILMMLMYTNSKGERNVARFEFSISVIMFFSVMSSILFLFVLLRIPLPITTTGASDFPTIFYLEVYNDSSLFGIFGQRNAGIYWEAGIYQIYLNLALIYYFNKNGINLGRRITAIIYIVAVIFTTGSVSGYVLCIVLFALLALFKRNNITIRIFIILVVASGIITLYPYLENALITKFSVDQSTVLRIRDLFFGLDIFKMKPFLGYGLVNQEYRVRSLYEYGVYRGCSNGMVAILINFGLVGFCMYSKYFSRFIVFIKRNIGLSTAVMLVAWFIVSINTEPIQLHPYTLFLLGIGIYGGKYAGKGDCRQKLHT